MEFNYTAYNTEEEIKKACEIAVKSRLYVPGWTMREFLTDNIHEIESAIIVRDENRSIGLGLIVREIPYAKRGPFCNKSDLVTWFMVFVRKSHRRKGIASEIFNKFKSSYGTDMVIAQHNKGSQKFFGSLEENLKQHPDYLEECDD